MRMQCRGTAHKRRLTCVYAPWPQMETKEQMTVTTHTLDPLPHQPLVSQSPSLVLTLSLHQAWPLASLDLRRCVHMHRGRR